MIASKLCPVGSPIEVKGLVMNDRLYEFVKGTYGGPINRGPEKGKHWVTVNTVRLAIEGERIVVI